MKNTLNIPAKIFSNSTDEIQNLITKNDSEIIKNIDKKHVNYFSVEMEKINNDALIEINKIVNNCNKKKNDFMNEFNTTYTFLINGINEYFNSLKSNEKIEYQARVDCGIKTKDTDIRTVPTLNKYLDLYPGIACAMKEFSNEVIHNGYTFSLSIKYRHHYDSYNGEYFLIVVN